ncbi:hypothetical protein EDD11_008094 [Mortierella claussenii]|nr:hypothetical protein EDD11_008094 [Mortierella claussenii]
MVIRVESQDQLDDLVRQGKAVFVEFYERDEELNEIPAGTTFQQLAKEDQEKHAQVTYMVVNLQDHPELREPNQVSATPLFRAYHHGQDLANTAGFNPGAVLKVRDSLNFS